MDMQTWIAFVAAYAVISVIPGPSVFMVVSQAMAHGRRAGLTCAAGDLAGGVVLMSAAFAGMGAVLAASSLAFQVLKWAGIAYLAWLGLRQITAVWQDDGQRIPSAPQRAGRTGFLTGVLNPKAIGFYIAFLPQFIDPARPQLPQLAVLMLTASAVVGLILGGYALLAARLSGAFSAPRARRRFGLTSGTCMLGGSAWMAATR